MCNVMLWQCYIWTMALGFSLAFGAMFSKTWRVHKIFTNKKIQRMVSFLSDLPIAIVDSVEYRDEAVAVGLVVVLCLFTEVLIFVLIFEIKSLKISCQVMLFHSDFAATSLLEIMQNQ